MIRLATSLAIVLATLATPSAAQDDEVDLCAGDGLIAGLMMTHRQAGTKDINEMMKTFGEVDALRAMILDAFETPRAPTRATQLAAIDEFKTRWSAKCYRDGPALPRESD